MSLWLACKFELKANVTIDKLLFDLSCTHFLHKIEEKKLPKNNPQMHICSNSYRETSIHPLANLGIGTIANSYLL